MIRNIFIFLGTFALGAFAALAFRTASFQPHPGAEPTPPTRGEYSSQVSNPLTPAKSSASASAAPPASSPATPATQPASPTVDPHAGHHGSTAPASTPGVPVNTRCAICGMPVDPSLPTLEYQGKTIGFGCKMCAPKFKADPDRYGPTYLRNEVMKK